MSDIRILIAESGSTKTNWSWHPDSVFSSLGLNPMVLSEAEIGEELLATVAPILAQNELSFDVLYFYGAGCAKGEAQIKMQKVLQRYLGNRVERIVVESDIWAAIRATCQNESGFTCILGTGSNSCFYDAKTDAITAQVMSLGYILGDEGSGFALGKALLKAYLYNTLPIELKIALEQAYPMVLDANFLFEIFAQTRPNRYVASFAHFYAQEAKHPFIQKLVTKELRIFIEDILLLYKDIKLYPIHFIGSIAYYWKDILLSLGTEYELHFDKIYNDPLKALWAYHQHKK